MPLVFDKLRHKESSIVVVVSPLVSLMVDQVASATKKKIKALHVGQMDAALEAEVCEGKYQLLFMSPESLLREEKWREMLLGPVYLENLVGIAVDEAHCVKKWYIFVPFDALLLIIILFYFLY